MNETPHDRGAMTPAAWEVVEETLSAYALDILPADERAGVAAHLLVCADCRAAVAALRASRDLLALAPEPVQPSAGLKARLFAAVEAERRAGGGAPGGAPPPAPPPTTLPTSTEPPRLLRPAAPAPTAPAEPPSPFMTTWQAPERMTRARRDWWALPAAAVLLVGLGLGVWNLRLQGELAQQGAQLAELQRQAAGQNERLALYEGAQQIYALNGTSDAPAARGTFVRGADQRPTLLLRNLPPLPASQAYQVWYIQDGRPVSAQVLPAGASGQQQVQLPQDLPDAQQMAVSVEPAGGSPSPTGNIVLAGSL